MSTKRGKGDWLAQQLDGLCHNPDGSFSIKKFDKILEENGVTPTDGMKKELKKKRGGWQGRYRMVGGIELRKAIIHKRNGRVKLSVQVPESCLLEWRSKHWSG